MRKNTGYKIILGHLGLEDTFTIDTSLCKNESRV